ncbi:hypothetical protein [Bordetella genomosp. 8]|nr:hypothetical protein [Bordetella genomosp. 8]
MSTMSVSSNAGVMAHSQVPGFGDVDQVAGAESSVLRAMAEAEKIMGEAALKENADAMKACLDNREIALQKKRVAVHQSARKELDAAWDKNLAMLANAGMSVLGAAISFGCVYAAGKQMNKAVSEGSVLNMTRYTERGSAIDNWNGLGTASQTTAQGLGSATSSIGQTLGAKRDAEKKYHDVEGQMQDSDANVAMDLARRRSGDTGEANRRLDKVNELRLEFMRSAMRVLA